MKKLRSELMDLLCTMPMNTLPPSLLIELHSITKDVGFSGVVFTDVCEMWMTGLDKVKLNSYIARMKSGGYVVEPQS
jgi:hypothetical protein